MSEEKAGNGSAEPTQPQRLVQAEPLVIGEAPIDELLRRVPRWLARKCQVFGACVAFGAAYGAVFGACFLALSGPVGEIIGTAAFGAVFGALFGGIGGAVSGLIGNVFGGRVGWCLAGLLGSGPPAAILWDFAKYGSDGDYTAWSVGTLACVGVIVIGSFLGYTLASGLRTGKSAVPGVQRLAAIINDGEPLEQSAKPHREPTEVVPSQAPEGRGDEVAPARPMSPD